MNLKKIGLFLGPLICALAYTAPSPLISFQAWQVIGLAAMPFRCNLELIQEQSKRQSL